MQTGIDVEHARVPSQSHPRIRALVLGQADLTDLELGAGTPHEPLYRVPGSFRPDPLAGVQPSRRHGPSAHLVLFHSLPISLLSPLSPLVRQDGNRRSNDHPRSLCSGGTIQFVHAPRSILPSFALTFGTSVSDDAAYMLGVIPLDRPSPESSALRS